MKVLLGIGGRDDSWRALDRTVERTAHTGDDLTIAILDNPESTADPEAIRDVVDRRLAEHEVAADVRMIADDPAGTLVDIAEREGFDQIVLGGGFRSPMGKIQVGSIAEFVVLNAQTTVTLVR